MKFKKIEMNLTLLVLIIYSLVLVFTTGFMGFHGDTWEIIS